MWTVNKLLLIITHKLPGRAGAKTILNPLANSRNIEEQGVRFLGLAHAMIALGVNGDQLFRLPNQFHAVYITLNMKFQPLSTTPRG